MFDGTFTDGMNVGDGVEEYDEVGNHMALLDDFRTKHFEFVRQSSWQPLLADMVALRSYSFRCFADDRPEVGSGADEDDDSVLGCDGAYELNGAPQ